MKIEEFQSKFEKIVNQMATIVYNKGQDYSNKNDYFKNFKICEKLGLCDTETWILVRMLDKINRVFNLIGKENKVKDEKITDTLIDLANYSIILLIYLENNEK